jgi:hypothetical protein
MEDLTEVWRANQGKTAGKAAADAAFPTWKNQNAKRKT